MKATDHLQSPFTLASCYFLRASPTKPSGAPSSYFRGSKRKKVSPTTPSTHPRRMREPSSSQGDLPHVGERNNSLICGLSQLPALPRRHGDLPPDSAYGEYIGGNITDVGCHKQGRSVPP
ncbi:hypothetical protein PVAP13_3KG067800 [Panicum virgatum]|uniref:Uncharacterized protein n=1 Tax=Panicum virgatum TaxID=38727 RepID=A0A8T0UG00_PANVG|nr:hypothetical protein PVAP13_3KG067800 [Panicum virgatum]